MMTNVSSVRIQLHQSNSNSKRPAPTLQSIFSFIDIVLVQTAIWIVTFVVLHCNGDDLCLEDMVVVPEVFLWIPYTTTIIVHLGNNHHNPQLLAALADDAMICTIFQWKVAAYPWICCQVLLVMKKKLKCFYWHHPCLHLQPWTQRALFCKLLLSLQEIGTTLATVHARAVAKMDPFGQSWEWLASSYSPSPLASRAGVSMGATPGATPMGSPNSHKPVILNYFQLSPNDLAFIPQPSLLKIPLQLNEMYQWGQCQASPICHCQQHSNHAAIDTSTSTISCRGAVIGYISTWTISCGKGRKGHGLIEWTHGKY